MTISLMFHMVNVLHMVIDIKVLSKLWKNYLKILTWFRPADFAA